MYYTILRARYRGEIEVDADSVLPTPLEGLHNVTMH